MIDTNKTERLKDLAQVYSTWQELRDDDMLEDRREYDLELLAESEPHLNPEQVSYLYDLIQMPFEPNVATLYRTIWSDKDAQILAGNITESLHQSLDGWDDGEKVIIELFLHDLGRAQYETEQLPTAEQLGIDPHDGEEEPKS